MTPQEHPQSGPRFRRRGFWHPGLRQDGYRHPGVRRRGIPPWARGPSSGGPLRRSQEDRLAGGVASGLAARFGLNVTFVRTVFIVATLASGFGIAAYVVAWLLVPAAGENSNIASAALTDRRGIALAAGLGSLLVVLLLIASAFGAGWLDQLAWPLVLSAAGCVLIWRNAPAGEQAAIRRLTEPLLGLAEGRSRVRWRVLVALVLLAAGLITLVAGHPSHALLRPLAGVALVIAAIVVMLGPWWLSIARDLVAERQARIRAEERADMAARVHDSVLQTLALIQRRAGEPQQVIQLARAQERELRSWLYAGPVGSAATLASAAAEVAHDLED
ncbi:MAG TPA: PspC domain-containing protein, partial [Streptosporangiaceae bacterium]